MNKLITIAAGVLLSTSAIAGEEIRSIDIGTAIPMSDAKMETTNNKKVSLNDAKTQSGLLVMFSCNTCPVVKKSQDRTTEMVAYAQKVGLGVVIVNSNEARRGEGESLKDMAKYAKAQGYNVPYVYDDHSKLADAFGAARTPEVFLFDGNGKLMYKGAMEDNPTSPSESEHLYLKTAMDQMVRGMVPDPGSTKSIGCGIKRAS